MLRRNIPRSPNLVVRSKSLKRVQIVEVKKRLFLIKVDKSRSRHGGKSIQIKPVPLDLKSMNSVDCFILDCGRGSNIFIFMPESFSVMLRSKVTQYANSIRYSIYIRTVSHQLLFTFSKFEHLKTHRLVQSKIESMLLCQNGPIDQFKPVQTSSAKQTVGS